MNSTYHYWKLHIFYFSFLCFSQCMRITTCKWCEISVVLSNYVTVRLANNALSAVCVRRIRAVTRTTICQISRVNIRTNVSECLVC